MENDMTVWTSTEIKELDPAELKGILAYTDGSQSKSEDSSADTASTESPAAEDTPPAKPARPIILYIATLWPDFFFYSPVPTIEVLPTNEVVAITEPPP
jgi:hypothetical protein